VSAGVLVSSVAALEDAELEGPELAAVELTALGDVEPAGAAGDED
jgi:hypothetical protein